MSKASLKRRRQKLFDLYPFCTYCNTKLVLYPLGNTKRLLDNYATIDHVRSRYHPQKQEPNRNGETRTVLSCYKCNHKRGEDETLAIPIEQRWESSGRKPQHLRGIGEMATTEVLNTSDESLACSSHASRTNF